jgi:hypothetical protein
LIPLLYKLPDVVVVFIIGFGKVVAAVYNLQKCRNGVKTHYNVSRSKEAGWFQHSGNNNNCQHRILDLFVLSFFMLELVSKML